MALKSKRLPIFITFVAVLIIAIVFFILIATNKPSIAPLESLGINKLIPLKESDIKFDEYVYDFGEADEGEQIEHIFKFKNLGDKNFLIDRVRTSCGCTAAVLSDKNIPPNGEGEIKASLNTGKYEGFVSQNIHMDSNAPPIQLTIQGIVKTKLSIQPKNVNFGSVRQDASESRAIYITKAGDKNLEIAKAESSSQYISSQITEIPVNTHDNARDEYNKKFEITVILAPNIPLGKFNETITLYSNDEKYPQIEILVVGNIKKYIDESIAEIGSPIFFFPPLFFFGSVKKGETPTSKINIYTTIDEPLKIDKIENPLEEFISITITTKVEGKEYEIAASLKEGAPVGIVENIIVIHTNNFDQPYIEIPVNASIKE